MVTPFFVVDTNKNYPWGFYVSFFQCVFPVDSVRTGTRPGKLCTKTPHFEGQPANPGSPGTMGAELVCLQWSRSIVKYGGQGQSGQAIKLFQITPYVSDFQTLNNPGSWQPYRRLKKYFYFPFLTQVFHPWLCETCRAFQQIVLNERMWHFTGEGGQNILWTPPAYFHTSNPPESTLLSYLVINRMSTRDVPNIHFVVTLLPVCQLEVLGECKSAKASNLVYIHVWQYIKS